MQHCNHPGQFHPLVQTLRGRVSMAQTDSSTGKSTCRCIQIQFDNLMWQFPRQNLESLYRYISHLASPEGFAQNAYNQDQAVVVMAGHIMMALMKLEALEALHELLYMARVALLNRDLNAPLQQKDPSEERC